MNVKILDDNKDTKLTEDTIVAFIDGHITDKLANKIDNQKVFYIDVSNMPRSKVSEIGDYILNKISDSGK